MISPDDAYSLGRDYVARQLIDLIELELDESPPSADNLAPCEWYFFSFRVGNDSSVGVSNYVAVHKETGEPRLAGRLGE
jgi:hypothetical protein